LSALRRRGARRARAAGRARSARVGFPVDVAADIVARLIGQWLSE